MDAARAGGAVPLGLLDDPQQLDPRGLGGRVSGCEAATRGSAGPRWGARRRRRRARAAAPPRRRARAGASGRRRARARRTAGPPRGACGPPWRAPSRWDHGPTPCAKRFSACSRSSCTERRPSSISGYQARGESGQLLRQGPGSSAALRGSRPRAPPRRGAGQCGRARGRRPGRSGRWRGRPTAGPPRRRSGREPVVGTAACGADTRRSASRRRIRSSAPTVPPIVDRGPPLGHAAGMSPPLAAPPVGHPAPRFRSDLNPAPGPWRTRPPPPTRRGVGGRTVVGDGQRGEAHRHAGRHAREPAPRCGPARHRGRREHGRAARVVPPVAPDDRSWVGLVAQAGIAAFLEWYAEAGRRRDAGETGQAAQVPRHLRHGPARADPVGDPAADTGAGAHGRRRRRGAGDRARGARRRAAAARGRAAVLPRGRLRRRRGLRAGRRGPRRLGRPARGAGRRRPRCAARPTSRCSSRAAALGWGASDQVAVVVGGTPHRSTAAGGGRRAAPCGTASRRRAAGGVQGDRLVVHPRRRRPTPSWRRPTLADRFGRRAGGRRPHRRRTCSPRGARPGPRCPACVAAPAWPEAPRPVLGRRPAARARARPATARRAAALVDRSLPAPGRRRRRRCSRRPRPTSSRAARWRPTARLLFVHPNTVRYRLRRVDGGHRLRPRRSAGGASSLAAGAGARAGWPAEAAAPVDGRPAGR